MRIERLFNYQPHKISSTTSTNNTKKREKALEKYDKAIEKYDTAQPAGERMAEQSRKAREARTVKNARVRLREKTKALAISRLYSETSKRERERDREQKRFFN